MRDKHDAAFRDDSEKYYALARERVSWPRSTVLLPPFQQQILLSALENFIRGLEGDEVTVGERQKIKTSVWTFTAFH